MSPEERMRADLAADPANLNAADHLARLLLVTGRAEEALAVTGPRA